MNNPDILKAIEPVTKLFKVLGIQYLIGGSVASSMLGLSRTTLDVDIISTITANKVTVLYEGLKDKYYIDKVTIVDAIKNHSSFNIIHVESMFKIDIFILKDREYDKESFSRKRIDNFSEGDNYIEIYIYSPEDIILNKLEWYKLGGEISERQWNDVKGVIKVQDKNLDLDYLKKWAKELKVNDLLEKVLNEAK
ncbi:MAG: hypothetical protein NTU73_12920 [Ignavibacteriae bacterium]|nr:hypothetical protein [Ignavibacteriota bacterium]